MIVAIARKNRVWNLKLESGKKENFYDGRLLWLRLQQLGEKMNNQGRTLYVYALRHNDLWWDYHDKSNLHIRRVNNDFLALQEETQEQMEERWRHKPNSTRRRRVLITYTDILNLYTRTIDKEGQDYLEAIRRLIELPTTAGETDIILEAVQTVKRKAKEQGIGVHRIISINQLAVNNIMQLLRQSDLKGGFFQDNKRFYTPERLPLSKHEGRYKCAWSRGGYMAAFKKGKYAHTTKIDSNGNWQYCLTQIKVPDLSTERHLTQPLDHVDLKSLLHLPSVLLCAVQTPSSGLGILSVRTGSHHKSIYPCNDNLLIGWWTNIELQYALEQGYTIVGVAEATYWQPLPYNPFKPIVETLYSLRKKDKSSFDNWFYKQLGNSFLGKFNMAFPEYDYKYIALEACEEYEKKGYRIVDANERTYLVEKELGLRPRGYYAPIIYALTTAYSRVYMHKHYQKVIEDGFDLLYTDTDSLIVDRMPKEYVRKHFTIGQGLGKWKLEGLGQECVIWGDKFYRYGDDIHAAGVRKGKNTKAEFDSGFIKRVRNEHGTLKEELITFDEEEEIEVIKGNIYIDALLEKGVEPLRPLVTTWQTTRRKT